MPNNTYVLNRTISQFLRPNNTTAYSAFTIMTNNAPLIVPAPVSDRPFFIRYLRVNALPGMAATLSAFVYIFSGDPSGVMSFTDGSFANYSTAVNANLLESRLPFNFVANSQVSFLDISVPNNFSLLCPSGVMAFSIEVNAAYTPPANQRFSFEVITEYGN